MKKLAFLFLLFSASCEEDDSYVHPLDFFPEDTLVVAEISGEPWERLGEATYANEFLSLPSWQKFYHPLYQELVTLDKKELGGFGGMLVDHLSDARAWIGIPPDIAFDQRIYLGVQFATEDSRAVVLDLLSGATTQEIAGHTAFLLPGFGVFVLENNNLLGVIRGVGDSEVGVDELASDFSQMVNRLSGTTSGFKSLPSYQKMREVVGGDDTLFAMWFPGESWSLETLAKMTNEEPPEEIAQIAKDLGLHNLDGFCYSMSLDGSWVDEKFYLLGTDLWEDLIPQKMLSEQDLIGYLETLPDDTLNTQIRLFDFGALVQMMKDLYATINELSENRFNTEEVWNGLELAHELAKQAGPMFGQILRAEDLWSNTVGDIWIDLKDEKAFREGWNKIPDEVRELLAYGITLPNSIQHLGVELSPGRLVFTRTQAEEAEGSLGEQAGFDEVRARFEALATDGIPFEIVFVGPEIFANGLEALRKLDMEAWGEDPEELPVNLNDLPTFDEVSNLFPTTVGLGVRRQDGLLTKYQSPLGVFVNGLGGLSTMGGLQSNEEF
ncbi:MAG: hypothetical protein QGH51_02195 [Planctomycetota bacterium]|jgi:hypothetical protein|nr:hypothetical protein [Planctomycetota bacterium]MDP6940813.1 hypothetical protein [Planctomycetota bacterium]